MALTRMTSGKKVIITALTIFVAMVMCFAWAQETNAETVPYGNYKDNQETSKVGLRVKIVDEEGNGVAGVTLIATYGTEKEMIRIGPSNNEGIAESDPKAFQLLYKDKYILDSSPPVAKASVNRHVFKSPLIIAVSEWPTEYEKPCFRIPDYSSSEFTSSMGGWYNYICWAYLGHGEEAWTAYSNSPQMETYPDFREWNGRLDGIYDITIEDLVFPLFGDRGADLDGSSSSSHGLYQLPDTVNLSNESEVIPYGQIADNIYYTIGNDMKTDMYYAYGPILLETKKKPAFEVEVSKIEIGGSEELEGAELRVTGETDSGFEETKWISGKERKKIKLIPGNYFLTEIAAPDGYKIAEPIPFTVTDEGKVLVGEEEQAENRIIMEDEKEKPLLKIRKTSNITKAKPGDIIPFVITITNSGRGKAENVNILDTMGDDLEYVSDDNKGNVDGQKVTWTVDVPAGTTKTINIRCRILESAVGKVINNVEITNVENEFLEPSDSKDNFSVVLGDEAEPVENTNDPTDAIDATITKTTEPKEASKDSASTGDSIDLIIPLFLMILAALFITVRKKEK